MTVYGLKTISKQIILYFLFFVNSLYSYPELSNVTMMAQTGLKGNVLFKCIGLGVVFNGKGNSNAHHGHRAIFVQGIRRKFKILCFEFMLVTSEYYWILFNVWKWLDFYLNRFILAKHWHLCLSICCHFKVDWLQIL